MAKSRDSSAVRNAPDLPAVSQDYKALGEAAGSLFPELRRTGTEFRSAKEACQTLLGYLRTVIGKLEEVREVVEEKETGAAFLAAKKKQEETSRALVEAKDAVISLSIENESLMKQFSTAKRHYDELRKAQFPSDTSIDSSLHDRDKEILKLRFFS